MTGGGSLVPRWGRALGVATAAAVMGLAAGILGGCGTSTVTNVVDPVAKAATVSNQAPGMRLSFLMRLTTPALPAPITGTGNGIYDVAGHTGSVNLSMDFGGVPQVAQALGSSTLQLQELLEGGVVYLKLPPALARGSSSHGKPWIKINLATAARATGIPGLSSLLNNPTSSDPSQFLHYLRASSGNVTRVGTVTVDGYRTTEYRARIDLNRVPRELPAASRAQASQAIAALERTAHVRVLPISVWIDGQHLVRRMQFVFDETVSGAPLNVSMRIDIPQYGPQSPPQLPPSSRVADLTGALGASTSTGAARLSG